MTTDELSIKIPEVLQNLRKERGWTQLEVAERAGFNKSVYNRIETGNAQPNTEKIFSLAKAFDLEASDFLKLIQGREGKDDIRRNAMLKKVEELLDENERLKAKLSVLVS